MRIGSLAPRINGRRAGVMGMGGLGAPVGGWRTQGYKAPPVEMVTSSIANGMSGNVQIQSMRSKLDYVMQDLTASPDYPWGTLPAPGDCATYLRGYVAQGCILYPEACIGVDQKISDLCSFYSSWYGPAQNELRAEVVGYGGDTSTLPPVQAGYVPPAHYTSGPDWAAEQAGGRTPQENALDRVTPTQTQVTPTQATNVLAPPTGSQAINTTQQNTGTNVLTNPKSDGSDKLDVSGWVEDNWALLAAGAAGLFLMTMTGSRR